ncbi:MAG: hypothetical protein P4L87_21980 [Formivibrio sp.]|nr:hypothetical protein [Formivibrio sp.]
MMPSDTITDEKGNMACPASRAMRSPLSDESELHFAPAAELKANKGICSKCAAAFRAHNRTLLTGQKVETPSVIEKHHNLSIIDDHVAFADGGELEGVVDFDWTAVDGDLKEASTDARRDAAELIGTIFRWAFSDKIKLKTAVARLCVIATALNPELVNRRTFSEIGKELRMSKQSISFHTTRFQNHFNLKLPQTRSAAGRAAMSRSQMGHPATHTTKRGRRGVARRGYVT